MLREALTYPARADEETLLVGIILTLAAGLFSRLGVLAILAVVPAVLLAGYAQAVFRASADESSGGSRSARPPRFADLRALAGDGTRALAVAVGYLLVPTVALVVTFGGAATGGRSATFVTTLSVFGAGTVLLAVAAVFAYLLPAALAGVARTRSLRSAVARGRLRRTATSSRYFVGWVAALLVAGVAASLLGALAGLGRPGQIAALVLSFYAIVVVARLLGRAAG